MHPSCYGELVVTSVSDSYTVAQIFSRSAEFDRRRINMMDSRSALRLWVGISRDI